MSTEPDWKNMDHTLTPEKEKWVVMLCQAAGADNELKILTRFQKVVNAIYKEKVEPLEAFATKYARYDTEPKNLANGFNEVAKEARAVLESIK